jgi:hypothetical protein
MPASLASKLKIKKGNLILPLHQPDNYEKSLGELPRGARIVKSGKAPDQTHWFVMNRKQMEDELNKVLDLLENETVCWIFYPKGSSGIQTDLTRDKGWETLLKQDLQWINLISFDETWSAFGMRRKTLADRKKEAKPRERPIFDYVDPKTKTVVLPDDLAEALKKTKKENEFFQALSFTNKIEYIEWIVTARRDETRKMRVKQTLDRLGKGWKNPANR